MRFGILGATRVWRDDGSEATAGGPIRRALLTLLLARPGEVVTADRLVDDLYGGRPPAGAAHALQSQVSRLRGDLGREAAIELLPAGYRLAVDPDDVDAHRFERLSEEGRRSLEAGDPGQAAALLRAALGLWRGPALADAADAGSVQARALRLEERRAGALEDRIEADLRRGGHRAVVPELRELVGRHPLRERLHGLLMRALQADGRQAEALVAFEVARRLLAEELGADPSAELTALHRTLLRGERPSETPAPRQAALRGGRPPGAPAPHRAPPLGGRPFETPASHQAAPRGGRPFETPPLPAQLTSFVGRAEDVAKVTELLGTARLVTLIGPGGAGKTRLSIEVAGRRADVCLVELAPLRDGPEPALAVLGALGLRESGLLAMPAGTTPTSRLIAALADRPPLLVLDNCEHVVEAVATLAGRLLAGCPELRILATSREPLAITGEHLWPVRPLAPAPAARLFTDRAAAVRPGFVVDGADAEAVRRICQALDGLPLAIELAAARMRTHDLAELASRLDDRFRLLSRGSRTAEARHQTLRAVVAWSWDLLSEAEQTMARRLTVFSGGATAEAAARVCGGPDAGDVLDWLADKSLLEVGDGRYRMLDTIHAFCAERLDAAGESGALRRAHAEHFLALAQTADPRLRRSGQLEWLGILASEHENLLAALRWAVEAGEVELALRLLASLSSYFWMRGMRTSATAQAVALLDMIDGSPPPDLGDEYVLCALTAAASDAGREAWERHRATAESIVVDPDRPRRHPVITFLWPMINAGAGDPRAALSVIARGQAGSDPWERAVVHLLWGYPQLAAGDLAQAEHEFASAADAFRSLGDRWGTSLALDSLAGLAGLYGDPSKAIALIDEALALTEQLGAVEDLPDLLCNRGDHRVRTALAGRDGPGAAGTGLAEARADYERAAEIARHAGSPTYLAGALRGLGDIARLEGDPAGARRLYEQAMERFETHWVKSAGNRTATLFGLGKVAEAEGDLDGARSLHRQAVEVATAAGSIVESARAVEALAGLALLEGDAPAAALLLGAAAGLRGILTEDDPEVSRTAVAARAALGEEPYEAAHRRGARLPQEDALRLAGVPEAVIQASPINAVAGYQMVQRP